MYTIDNMNYEDITNELNVSIKKVRNVCKNIRKSNKPLSYLDNQSLNPNFKILIDNYEIISELFKTGYSTLSLKNQLQHLVLQNDIFQNISLSMYRRYINDVLKINHTHIKTVSIKSASDDTKNIRKLVSLLCLYTQYIGHKIYYFDESLVSDNSFKSKVWKKSNGKYHLPIRKSLGTINFLVLCSITHLESYWITRKANTDIVTSFLNESIDIIRSKEGNIPIAIFLDNCSSHRTKLMIDLANVKNVYLIYNAPNASKINMAEYIFAIAKRQFRLRYYKINMKIWENHWMQNYEN